MQSERRGTESTRRRSLAPALLAALALMTALAFPSARWLGSGCLPAGPSLVADAGAAGATVCELRAAPDRGPVQAGTITGLLPLAGFLLLMTAVRALRAAPRNPRRPDGRTVLPLVPPPTTAAA
jgi:hypothetical protein